MLHQLILRFSTSLNELLLSFMERLGRSAKTVMEFDYGRFLQNALFLPVRLLWNLLVTILLVGAFILWLGFVFGSVVGVILILIFAPSLFLLPLPIAALYVELWPREWLD